MAAAPPTEGEVGVTEYMHPELAGFRGRCKERWQDFHVHEVDISGTELHLSELITPGAVAAELKKASTERREARAALGPEFALHNDAEAELTEALGEGATQALVAFLRKQRPTGRGDAAEAPPEAGAATAPEAAAPGAGAAAAAPGFVDFDANGLGDGTKEARRRAHQAVLKHFPGLLSTETLDGEAGGVRTMRVWMREAERKVKSLPGAGAAAVEERDTGKGKKGKKGKGKGAKGKGKGKGDKGGAAAGADAAGEFGTLRREGWPKDRPDYLYFRLYKENIDTGEAVMMISRCVGRSPKQFTFAGTKDRRGITVQHICAHKLPADQLRRSMLHRGWDRRVRISDLEYRAERLRLGRLSGNHFRIVLRRVPAEATAPGGAVAKAFEGVASSGFLNYFGLQRFGTRATRTHRIGAAIIASRWDEAVRLILGGAAVQGEDALRKRPAEGEAEEPPRKAARAEDSSRRPADGEADEAARAEDSAASRPRGGKGGGKREAANDAARLFLEGGDAQAALDAMPRGSYIERCLLGALARKLPAAEALKQLPHQALSLYAHAAQSLVWNAVLSRRVRDLGRRPVPGDLVFAAPAAAATAAEACDDEGAILAEDEESDDAMEDAQGEQVGNLPAVRPVDAVDSLTLADVVLPLPGSNVRYPSALRAAYEESAQQLLGLSLEDFVACSLVPLPGSYRPAAVMPRGLEWRAVAPAEVAGAARGDLLQSDVGRLLEERPGAEAEAMAGDGKEPAGGAVAPSAPAEDTEGAAVVFSCTLPPSAYLTMLLREVTKESTAVEAYPAPPAT